MGWQCFHPVISLYSFIVSSNDYKHHSQTHNAVLLTIRGKMFNEYFLTEFGTMHFVLHMINFTRRFKTNHDQNLLGDTKLR